MTVGDGTQHHAHDTSCAILIVLVMLLHVQTIIELQSTAEL